jgi:holo-[acyl-carrier protein] synthase
LDVVDVVGFAEQVADEASGFVEATFRPAELRTVSPDPERRAWHLAGLFAAKEAFVKAWSASRRGRPPQLASVDLREIEVVDDGFGRPALRLHGAVREAVAGLASPGSGPPAPPSDVAAGLRTEGDIAAPELRPGGLPRAAGSGGGQPRMHVSISHDGGVAAATVILES